MPPPPTAPPATTPPDAAASSAECRVRRRFQSGHRVWLVVAVVVGLATWGGVTAWRRHASAARMEATYAPAPEGMTFIPAGPFIMGSDDPEAEHDERPQRVVDLPAFYIDTHEVTNAEYRRYDHLRPYPDGADDLPVTGLYRHDCMAYAAWAGKRLPTSAEWEKAARGVDGRRYPWGNAFVAGVANLRTPGEPSHGLRPVGSFPESASPYGLQDMAGSVWEWVADDYVAKSWWGDFQPQHRGILRGGGHNYGPFQARSSYQGFESLQSTCNDTGFRCARNASPVSTP